MKKNTQVSFLILLVLLSFLTLLNAELDEFACQSQSTSSSNLGGAVNEIKVGVILDMGSWVGKVVHSCITMAISDFYAVNTPHYETRVVLHIRDSNGEPLLALSAALDLIENIKVQAMIIGPETLLEDKLLALLGDKAKIPIISFATSPYSTHYPYSVQIKPDEIIEFKGIADIVGSFGWRNVVLVHEDTDCGREILPFLVNTFEETSMHISYTSSISYSATNDQILEELHKLKTIQTTVYIVHMSPLLSSRLFLNVKRLGMMGEGHAWIVTAKTMNLLHTMDSSSIESMQGGLGFKSYIPVSSELHNFTVRWRREFHIQDPSFEVAELNAYGIWVYDAIWALARAVEKVRKSSPSTRDSHQRGMVPNLMDLPNIGASQNGSMLLKEILQSRIVGLSGEFQLLNGRLISKAFEVVNVIDRGERRVGFWTPTDGIKKQMYPSNSVLEAIVWPGGSTTTPKGWLVRMSGKRLRIGVPLTRFKELINVNRNPQTNATTVTGFCVDVFNAAIEALQYELPHEFFPFEDANGQMAGTYNDLVDQVYLQNYDAVVGDLTITANRSLYVDFTSTYTDMGIGRVARVDMKKNMWIFLKPLDSDLWLTSAGFFILTGFVVWLIERPINEEFQGSRAQQIGTVLWFSFSTLVFAHRERLFSNLSRFVVIVWLFVVLILSSSYTATLTSLLTVQQIQLASNGDYIGYKGQSYLQGVIVKNLNFTDSRLRIYSSPEEYADALSSGSVAAIIDEIPYLKIFLAKYSGSYAMVASESTTSGFGFVFRKGSPLVPEISRAIGQLRENGTLMRIEQAWFNSPPSLGSAQNSSVTNSSPSRLNFDSFRGLFLISGLSSASALVILSIQSLYQRWHAKVHRFRNLICEVLVFWVKLLSTTNSNLINQIPR
ncbi:Glutamate receptor 1.3 [Camellia lanceoleosa]|uniref:Glutamate receptor 1.3 n=1 Tax=Camellia lanceoleosa TaxID=1840588 RepID=A0ACC0F9C4_9ERIC|nr:Glutamate receptor 1.3 [Camellia lanceoleosa]